jgi:hypothetical protein
MCKKNKKHTSVSVTELGWSRTVIALFAVVIWHVHKMGIKVVTVAMVTSQ